MKLASFIKGHIELWTVRSTVGSTQQAYHWQGRLHRYPRLGKVRTLAVWAWRSGQTWHWPRSSGHCWQGVCPSCLGIVFITDRWSVDTMRIAEDHNTSDHSVEWFEDDQTGLVLEVGCHVVRDGEVADHDLHTKVWPRLHIHFGIISVSLNIRS